MQLRSEASLTLPLGTSLFQRYEVLKLLHSGETTAVYSCQDNLSGKKLAFKILLPSHVRNHHALAALRTEFNSCYQVRHANVVSAEQFFCSEQCSGFSMEYVEGWNLAILSDSASIRSVTTVINLVAQLTEALDAMHRWGMVHHGIDAENVLVATNMNAKICDFGSVQAKGEKRSTTAASDARKAEYQSPELLSGSAIADQRSDIYSLGVLAYKLLTGQFPYPFRTLASHIAQKQNGKVVRVEQLRTDCTWGLQECIHWMLEPEPAARPQNVKDILDYLYQLHPKARPRHVSQFDEVKEDVAGKEKVTNLRSKISDLYCWLSNASFLTPTVCKTLRLEYNPIKRLPPPSAQ